MSPREQEIAPMVAKGYPNKTIAAVLEISVWTVATYLRRIFAKLGVSPRVAMVARMLEEDGIGDRGGSDFARGVGSGVVLGPKRGKHRFLPTTWDQRGNVMTTQLVQVRRDRLEVTSGEVLEHEPGFLEVTEPIMRAVMREGRSSTASLQFRFMRSTEVSEPAGSGQRLLQIGLKLRSKDPCNLIYVMWRIRPQEELVVQVKRNPGQSTSAECGNRGYTTVGRVPHPTPQRGALHDLTAEVRRLADGDVDVIVWTDWEEALRERIDPDLLKGIDGPAGFRTDNGIFNFRFYVGG
jgi:DNA-binding CsgD family transcriptional regulator